MMNLNPATWDPQTLSGIRNTLQALGGVAVAFGLVTATQAHDLIDKVGEIGAALGVIITAGGFIVSFIMGVLGNRAASPAAQVANVAVMTGPEKVEALKALPDATRLVAVDGLVGVKVAVNPALASPEAVAVARDSAAPQVSIGTVVPATFERKIS